MPTPITIDQLGPLGAGLLSALQAVAFEGDCWSPDSWSVLLNQPGVVARVAQRQGVADAAPLGILLTRVIDDHAEILTLGVDPAARRRGVARALLADFLRLCRHDGVAEVALEVAMTNAAARALYAGLGFRQVGRRPHYYTCVNGVRTDAANLLYDPR